jgi:rhodanese-related sulfurtransferase
MKTFLCLVLSVSVLSVSLPAEEIPNRLIDYPGFLADAAKVGELRKTRRVTEDEFMRMASEPETIVLDARSHEKYELLHLKGAVHLSLPDVTADELAKVIPAKTTRVLIYCNNNFENEQTAFASKRATASLNIYTFNTLYSYGYTNVYELGPLLDIKKTKLPLEGTRLMANGQKISVAEVQVTK